MGLYFERNWKLSAGVILLIAAFLMIYVPWIIAGQELFDEAKKLAPMSYWLADGVHPTPAGHKLLTKKWLETMGL